MVVKKYNPEELNIWAMLKTGRIATNTPGKNHNFCDNLMYFFEGCNSLHKTKAKSKAIEPKLEKKDNIRTDEPNANNSTKA